MIGLLFLLLQTPTTNCLAVPVPPALATLAIAGGFIDPNYVNNQPAPCVLYGQVQGNLTNWTITFNDTSGATQIQIQFYDVTNGAGYWMVDVATGQKPAFTFNVHLPTANADGTFTVYAQPPLLLDHIYRIAISDIINNIPSAVSSYSQPIASVAVLPTGGSTTNLLAPQNFTVVIK